MSPLAIHVVGDRFLDFAKEHSNVLTLTQLEAQLARGEPREEVLFILGQGLQAERLRRLEAVLGRPEHVSHLRLHPSPHPERAAPQLIHKRFGHNVMISFPWQVEEELFKAFLMVDDGCAEMSDHLTGRHLQGMVLAEAGRQMVIAVTERFLLPQEPGRASFFVINQFDISFLSFAFPVCTEIECKLMNTRLGKRGMLVSEAEVRFTQGGECITSGAAKFSAYDASFMKVREANKARQLLSRAVA